MGNEFKVGDVVRHKSGGPIMVVLRVDLPTRSLLYGNHPGGVKVEYAVCERKRHDGEWDFQTKYFAPESLSIYHG